MQTKGLRCEPENETEQRDETQVQVRENDLQKGDKKDRKIKNKSVW